MPRDLDARRGDEAAADLAGEALLVPLLEGPRREEPDQRLHLSQQVSVDNTSCSLDILKGKCVHLNIHQN